MPIAEEIGLANVVQSASALPPNWRGPSGGTAGERTNLRWTRKTPRLARGKGGGKLRSRRAGLSLAHHNGQSEGHGLRVGRENRFSRNEVLASEPRSRLCVAGPPARAHERPSGPPSVYYWAIVANSDLDRAVSLLGPLEGRIMRAIWAGEIHQPLVVRSLQPVAPELAYTTLMTTLNRLAEKGLLFMQRVPDQRAHQYRSAGTPEQFLTEASRAQAAQMLDRFGDAALVAFATRLDELTPEQRERLQKLAEDA